MKNIAVTSLLATLSLTCLSQTRKLPPLGMLNEKTIDTNVIRTGITKIKEVAFKPSRRGRLDTEYVFYINYNSAGQLIQTAYYGYDSVQHESYPEIVKLAGPLNDRLMDCSRITYDYDAHGNLVMQMSYNITPAGSYEAFLEHLSAALRKEDRDGDRQQPTEQEMNRIADSIKKAGIPAIEKEGKLSRFRYNADDNMIYSMVNYDERNYTYEYNTEGRVKIRREVWNRNSPGSPVNMSAAELWLTYTPDGWPATITTYVGNGDTGDIAVDRHMMRKEEISYNKAGQKIRIQTSNSGKPYHKVEAMAYKNDLPVSDAVYEVNRTTGRNDTTTYTTLTWGKNLRTSTKRKYYDGKIMRIEREEVYLDDNGLQTKVQEYAKPGARPEVLTAKRLYFYDK